MLTVSKHFESAFNALQQNTVLRARVEQVLSSRPDSQQPQSQSGDKVKIVLPHCGRDLVVYLLLQESAPETMPDLILGEDDDGLGISLAQLPSLALWDLQKSSHILPKIFLEFKTAYNELQKQKAESCRDERLRFELDTIHTMPGVEYDVIKPDNNKTDVHLNIPLHDISVDPLLEALPAGSPMRERILNSPHPLLVVTFTTTAAPPHVVLRAPTVWNDLLGSVPKPPSWTNNSCLVEYIPSVKEMLMEYIRTFSSRRALIREFVRQATVIEYDSFEYRKVALVGEYDSNQMVVFVQLTTSFPQEPPLVTLQSMAHYAGGGRSLARNLTKLAWSPRWSAEEMTRRIRSAVAEALSPYLKFCEEEAV